MALKQHEWQRALHAFRLQSQHLDDALRMQSWNDTWQNTAQGQALCRSAQECWAHTVAWWSRYDINEEPNSVMAYATITVDFLDGLACDYVYRRNNAVPSGPLWDALDGSLDMPALWGQLLEAMERRRCDDWYVNESLSTLNRRLSLVALARVQSNYPMLDSQDNSTVWADIPELNHFWHSQEDPDNARHQSLTRGLHCLPSSHAPFYAYAALNRLPDKTTTFLLEHCRFDPADASMDAVLLPWCSWLATLLFESDHWKKVQQKWPDLANIIRVVHALDSSENTNAQVLHLYRRALAPTLASPLDIGGLFDSVLP